MISPTPEDAPLDALLRQQAAAEALPDDGFSQRVLTALPPPTRAASSRARWIVCAIGGVIGTIVAAAGLLSAPAASGGWSEVVSATVRGLAVLAEPPAVLALTVAALSWFFACGPFTRGRA